MPKWRLRRRSASCPTLPIPPPFHRLRPPRPPAVALGHALLAGLVSATIVTVSHQSEEMFDEPQHDWVASQLRSTRDARTGINDTELYTLDT